MTAPQPARSGEEISEARLRALVREEVRRALDEPAARARLLDELAAALRLGAGVSERLDPRRARQAARPLEYKGLPDWTHHDSRTSGGPAGKEPRP